MAGAPEGAYSVRLRLGGLSKRQAQGQGCHYGVVDFRYERRSLVVTTNRAFKDWNIQDFRIRAMQLRMASRASPPAPSLTTPGRRYIEESDLAAAARC